MSCRPGLWSSPAASPRQDMLSYNDLTSPASGSPSRKFLRPTMHTRNKNLPLQQGCPLYSNCHRGEARSQGRSTIKRSAGRAMAVLATIPSARAQAPGAASAQTTRRPVKPAARTAGGRVARVSDMTCEQSRSASRTSEPIAIWEKGHAQRSAY